MHAFRRLHRFLIHTSLSLLLGLAACDSATGPEDTAEPEPEPEPPSVTVGVLLQGNSASPALGSLRDMMPTPAPDSEILGDLLASRLRAVLNPSATVAEVNTALVAQDVGIISMLEGHPFITLAMPPVPSEAEAEALAATLKASGAFVHVSPTFEFVPAPVEASGLPVAADRVLPPSGLGSIEHLAAIRLPAAWNAKALAATGALPMTVVVPDSYYSLNAHAEIDCLQFEGGVAKTILGDGWWPGNHGFHVAGIIGADFDGGPPTGTNPDPRSLLEIRAFSRHGLDFSDYMRQLFREAFPWGSPFVVNLSLYYTRSFITGSRLDIAFDALELRRLIADVQDHFLFVVIAGNHGENADASADARFAYPPAVAHFFADLTEVFAGTGVSSQDSLNFVDHVAWTYIEKPEAANVLRNVLVVGSSDIAGAESRFSSRNSHLRAVGERVLGPCVIVDDDFVGDPNACDGDVARYSGTSMAAPTIAGLAAYLWNLDPALTVSKARQILLHAYNESNTPGLVDAYIAALALDTWPDAGVRRALLDVAGDAPMAGSNGRFDDNDIELFMDQFAAAQGRVSDWSRYDLNGDGFTGGKGTARVDLTADYPPVFSSNLGTMIENGVVHFNERAVSDCDVLRYYAYTSLYEGDEDRRRLLLLPCAGVDLSTFTRLIVNVDIQAVYEYADGTRTEIPVHSIWAVGDGSITGGVLDYLIDDTSVNPVTTDVYSGHMGGSMDTQGGRINQLQVDFEKVTWMWDQPSQTDSVTMVLQDLPLVAHSPDWLSYEVKGPESCASIVSLSSASTWRTGSWTLVDYSCQPTSKVWIQLARLP